MTSHEGRWGSDAAKRLGVKLVRSGLLRDEDVDLAVQTPDDSDQRTLIGTTALKDRRPSMRSDHKTSTSSGVTSRPDASVSEAGSPESVV